MTKDQIEFANKTGIANPKTINYLFGLEDRIANLEKAEVKKSVKPIIKKDK